MSTALTVQCWHPYPCDRLIQLRSFFTGPLPASHALCTNASSATYKCPIETHDTEKKILVSDINVSIHVGVTQQITTGFVRGAPQTEFKLVTTNRRLSGDGVSLLIEKQTMKITCKDRFARLARALSDGSVVHVVGRLHFQPRFNPGTMRYDLVHEIVIADNCGSLIECISGQRLNVSRMQLNEGVIMEEPMNMNPKWISSSSYDRVPTRGDSANKKPCRSPAVSVEEEVLSC